MPRSMALHESIYTASLRPHHTYVLSAHTSRCAWNCREHQKNPGGFVVAISSLTASKYYKLFLSKPYHPYALRAHNTHHTCMWNAWTVAAFGWRRTQSITIIIYCVHTDLTLQSVSDLTTRALRCKMDGILNSSVQVKYVRLGWISHKAQTYGKFVAASTCQSSWYCEYSERIASLVRWIMQLNASVVLICSRHTVWFVQFGLVFFALIIILHGNAIVYSSCGDGSITLSTLS